MDKAFWLARWQQNQIGFHEAQTHTLLTRHWDALGVPRDATVFVPLCGKSLDMRWLHERGHTVLGVELSELACSSFFAEAGLAATRREGERFVHFEARRYRLLCGDVFDLAAGHLQQVRAVYDRAALIALPPPMRQRYARHLLDLLPSGVSMLLVTLEFDAAGFSSPPFAVSPGEVERLFGARCRIAKLDSESTTVKGQPAVHSALRLDVQ